MTPILMTKVPRKMTTRRNIIKQAALSTSLLLLPPGLGFGPGLARVDQKILDRTPACHDDPEPTPSTFEGPYFSPQSPERTDITENRNAGTPFMVGGYVLKQDCTPIANALIEIWQADDQGRYDNRGYYLRGHQKTDQNGRWSFATIIPGLYPGRSRHIHFKVQGPDTDVLTTQIFFPDDARNDDDYQFDARLLVTLDGRKPLTGRFDFVL